MNPREDNNLDIYLSGKKLYGDDFSEQDILAWYKDEEEAYASLGAEDRENYEYVYNGINKYHGYSHIDNRNFSSALGFGSAYGDEFSPILNRISRITILDPSEKFVTSSIGNVPIDYRKPAPSGIIPAGNSEFDLFTCFGVLHHIPNVSFVISELGRVMSAGGYGLIREPVTSMGDWRRPRRGLTSRERGIPHEIADNALRAAGFEIVYKEPCFFPPLKILFDKFGGKGYYNNKRMCGLDHAFSKALRWNISYRRDMILKKISPTCYFWIVKKLS